MLFVWHDTLAPNTPTRILSYSIILESSYSLYDRAFADNIGTVLFYAVIVSFVFFLYCLVLDTILSNGKQQNWPLFFTQYLDYQPPNINSIYYYCIAS